MELFLLFLLFLPFLKSGVTVLNRPQNVLRTLTRPTAPAYTVPILNRTFL